LITTEGGWVGWGGGANGIGKSTGQLKQKPIFSKADKEKKNAWEKGIVGKVNSILWYTKGRGIKKGTKSEWGGG